MRMIARALDAGVAAGWVTGDEVYGQHAKLRMMLEERQIPYVLAVAVNQRLIATVDGRIAQLRADELAAMLPGQAWKKISPGTAPRARGSTTGPGQRSARCRTAPATGCWCGAA